VAVYSTPNDDGKVKQVIDLRLTLRQPPAEGGLLLECQWEG